MKKKRKVVRVSEIIEAVERLKLPDQGKDWGTKVTPWEQWNDNLNAILAELDL